MSVLDLNTRGNWELLTGERRSVVYTNNTKPSDSNYKYTPISPIYTTANSRLLLVGVASNSAKSHWFLGARVSQYLYVSPSATAGFISGVQVEDTKKAGLGKLTLIEFKNYNVFPYVVELDIPYWLEDVYVEVWEYKEIGNSSEVPSFAELLNRLDALESRLERIETKVDAIENYGA